jgi:hypothetical protein
MGLTAIVLNQQDVLIHNRDRSLSEVESLLCHEFPQSLDVLLHNVLNAAHELYQMIANLC